ncbi:MAG: PGF-CTERM sorting domain-containing protein [Methanolobus sp.]|uniref:PGF-CTERM sorting domain-containing protein n=1 Tax=Methanolobus sp. TaxID=1874737 RepID=UPI00272F70D3|nr:PGF-CTERM sorting domain-containing protein [Methanolobus sp.]MDP2216070.1 PGF-CTERM sorting domain-containing protein [Methanolobus sp.]
MNNNLVAVILLVIIMLLGSPIVSARPAYLDAFNQQYDTEDTKLDACATCHINPNGGGSRNPYGMAYAASGRDFASIEALDSDGDGFTNLEEINALTFPGDPADYPQTESETPSTEDISAPVNEDQEQETNEEPSGELASEQQSPGFGAVLAIVGVLSAIYFKRKG